MERRHSWQRAIGWIAAFFWVPLAALVLRYRFGYRIAEVAALRREFARIRSESDRPLLVCANHLTLIDSFLVAWGLASPWRFMVDFDALPWNTPEETNFGTTRLQRLLIYFAKCIPIRRGGNREDIAAVLARVIYALGRGEIVMLFPEGGRSRTGRVAEESAAWGVGRIVGATPGCRVLCVYLRGEAQETWSNYPVKGDTLHMEMHMIEPKSDRRGVRRSRDMAGQIVAQLVRMEESHFDARK
jgi:1-acyl-sn-glycerol-3-phosphate acyltransferase